MSFHRLLQVSVAYQAAKACAIKVGYLKKKIAIGPPRTVQKFCGPQFFNPLTNRDLQDKVSQKKDLNIPYNILLGYSGRHWKVYECCFMKQNCHFQSGVLQCKIASRTLISSNIHSTHQHFQKRYITLLLLRGLKSYQPSKFESLYFLSKTHFTFLSGLITFKPLDQKQSF